MSTAAHTVTFNDADDAWRVNELIRLGFTFAEATDLLELRPLAHFAMTRTDLGPDCRGDVVD